MKARCLSIVDPYHKNAYPKRIIERQDIIERIDQLDEAGLAVIEKQLDMLEQDTKLQGRGLTKEFTGMVSDIKEHNKGKDQDELQRKIDEAVDAVRYR